MAEHPVDTDELQRLGLYDPHDEHAPARLALIGYLFDLGATVEDLRRAGVGRDPRGRGRFVKLIDDEVMFVAADPSAACEIALDIVARLSAHPRLPEVRGAVAAGDILTRDGDYFGPLVNLAARTAKLAHPGCVLASEDLARQAGGLRFGTTGSQRLDGFDEPVELFLVEPAS